MIPPATTLGRVPPHSVEAEEQLLSACLLDPDIITRCIDGKIAATSFYVPANRVTYDCLVSLHNLGKPVDLSVIAEELKATRQLDGVGGYGYLTRISDRIPTTVGAAYFIDKVRELALLREMIRVATNAVENCYSFSGGIHDFVTDAERQMNAVTSQLTASNRVRSIGDFKIPEANDHDNLLGDRYLCRGHIGMLVGGSGIGKSTFAYQVSILWALGRPAFGIAPPGSKKLRSVHFQSEDEEGDLAKARECVAFALGLTDAERMIVYENVLIKTEKVLTGDAFLADMAKEATRHKADIVWLNPLQAFMEGDIKDARDVKQFTRTGLNRANRDSLWATMIVHHTPKPATANNVSERSWNEVMYEGAGSADLVNVCRTVMVLKATKTEGEFNLHLAKRGAEAGVTAERESDSGIPFKEVLRQIPMRHAKGRITMPGHTEATNLLFWESRAADKPVEKPKSTKRQRLDVCDGEVLDLVPSSSSEFGDANAIRRAAGAQTGVGTKSATAIFARLTTEGHIQPAANGGIRRTRSGDRCVEQFLAERP